MDAEEGVKYTKDEFIEYYGKKKGLRWLKSAATPSGGTIATLKSNTESAPTLESNDINIASGWPIPPAPPHTHTLKNFLGFASLSTAFAFAFAFTLAFGFAFAFAF